MFEANGGESASRDNPSPRNIVRMERDGDGSPLPERRKLFFRPANTLMAVGEFNAISAVTHDGDDFAGGANFVGIRHGGWPAVPKMPDC